MEVGFQKRASSSLARHVTGQIICYCFKENNFVAAASGSCKSHVFFKGNTAEISIMMYRMHLTLYRAHIEP